MSTELGVWLAALFTLGIFSFLYRDNPFYKFCESVFIGVSAGYWAITYYFDNLYRKMYVGMIAPAPGEEANWWLLGGLILGVLMLTRLFNQIGWLARWPVAFIVGATSGLYMLLFFVSNALNQVASTMVPLVARSADGAVLAVETIGTIIIAIGVVSGLVYFFFSKEHRGLFGGTARLGIFFLMVTFGAAFGYTVMSRMSLLIGRMDFLFGTWLGLTR